MDRTSDLEISGQRLKKFIQRLTHEDAISNNSEKTLATLQKITPAERNILITQCQYSIKNYCKTQLWKSERCEVLLVGWLSGQHTKIHDHGGSSGYVMALQGFGTEVHFQKKIPLKYMKHVA